MSDTQHFANLAVTTNTEDMTITDESGASVRIGAGAQAERISRMMWMWAKDRKAASGYIIDDTQRAREIVYFWNRGAASNAEARIIEAMLAVDETLRARFEDAFPALSLAVYEWRRRGKPFLDEVENEAKLAT